MSGESTISQLPLPFHAETADPDPATHLFEIYTVDDATACHERVRLEQKYAHLLKTTRRFNRQLVSYQHSKQATLHRWLKFKEGFSARLVASFMTEYQLQPGHHILDPFAGSGTTLLVAQEQGIHATGIELLPLNAIAWQAKSAYQQYDVQQLEQIRAWIAASEPQQGCQPFPHIPITKWAFSAAREHHLMWYADHLPAQAADQATKNLLQLLLLSILEDISYTRKDGQYLRWDARSEKVQRRNRRRLEQGKQPVKAFHKGTILEVKDALLTAIDQVIVDVKLLQVKNSPSGDQQLMAGTVLKILPTLAANQYEMIMTSPPYCNRYDYTRTYALELAYLGLNHQAVVDLRQTQLSCTVENRPKLEALETFYQSINRSHDFKQVVGAIRSNAALQETFAAIEKRAAIGDLNNRGIVQMVNGYFTELAFVIFELFRVAKPGARIIIVNDNVRYGGEIIPVDLLMTDLAVSVGFQPEIIHVLPQRKGNSSQQMGKFGREALRKSITVWQKPV